MNNDISLINKIIIAISAPLCTTRVIMEHSTCCVFNHSKDLSADKMVVVRAGV